MLRTVARMIKALEIFASKNIRKQNLSSYKRSDHRPWSIGYDEYKAEYLSKIINDDAILMAFRKDKPLPDGYGFRLDARVVEIPWVLVRLANRPGYLLDAGSSFNYEFLLKAPALAYLRTIIVTLAPEAQCYWRLGVSYVFGDLRNLDFRDSHFDVITCISTIEHIGMDNTMYAGAIGRTQFENKMGFMLAINELKRVLKPGGVLYVTLPFGRYENHGWFQQFDSQLLDMLIEGFGPIHVKEVIFKYDSTGWKLSNRISCAHCQYFDVHTSKYFNPNSTIEYPPDYPAGERAIACLELFK
jgi:SAM-dependent methyltransferase